MSETAREIVRELAEQGALARLVNGQLRVKPPQGGLTDEMRGRIRANVAGIVSVLTSHPCEGCQKYAFPTPGVICFKCRKNEAEAA